MPEKLISYLVEKFLPLWNMKFHEAPNYASTPSSQAPVSVLLPVSYGFFYSGTWPPQKAIAYCEWHESNSQEFKL